MKTCSYCKIPLDRSAFNKNRFKNDGLQGICRICAPFARKRTAVTKPVINTVRKGSCKVGDKVFYNDRPILVQNVLDYCPEMRKSYISACAIDTTGRPLLGVSVLAGYDWEFNFFSD